MLYVDNANNSDHVKASLCKFVEEIAIPKSARILIKPNLVSLEGYPYTTDPQIICELIELLNSKGAKQIIVGDGPCPDQGAAFNKVFADKAAKVQAIRAFHSELRNTDSIEKELDCYKRIEHNIEEYFEYFFKQLNMKSELPNGAQYVNLFSPENNIPLKTVEMPDYGRLQHLDLSFFNVIINLPLLKLHTTAGFTAATKNLYGILTPFNKVTLHKYEMVGAALKYLCNYLNDKKIYSFLDCRKVPDAQQPIWGTSKTFNLDAVIYGDNLLEIDMKAKEMLDSAGITLRYKDRHYIDLLNKCVI